MGVGQKTIARRLLEIQAKQQEEQRKKAT